MLPLPAVPPVVITSRLSNRPLWLLYACTALIVAVLGVADVATLLKMRESALRNAESNLLNMSVALSEQADRAVQGLDLVLASMSEFVVAEGVTDGASYREKMANYRVHDMLREKIVGLPHINAVTMIGTDGRLINFSRYWPIPQVNVADRDYFKAMRADPTLQRFLSVPVQNRGDNAWTVYLARRVPSRDGAFAGLLLGAIELTYFEDFYRSMALGEGRAISLLREDGVLLVRYPKADVIGQTFLLGGQRALSTSSSGVIRELSPVDGAMRLKAARKLTNYPALVLVTQTETTALAEWHRVALVLSLITLGACSAIVVAGLAIARWWREQQVLSRSRAEHAETARARAVAETELLRERERHAEESSRAKSSFLAMMSHEIRTPMNAVLGLAGTLLDSPLMPAQREIVETIRQSGDILLRILNDVLDFSKLDANAMTFEKAPFSPGALLQDVTGLLGPRAKAKGLALVAETDPGVPAGLMGDAGRIRQVLLNLVSNAVKFTDAGSVTVRASCVGRDAGGATVEWSIADTGIGIPPERIGGLFRAFVQADASINRRFGGSGLGLAISKRLVDHMGGTITVDSAVGKGTTFCLRLTLPVSDVPLAPPPQADALRLLTACLAELGRPVHILIAEDNPTNQFVALQMLKNLPLQVDVAADGLEAVDAAARVAYDVIFMDMRMPEMDGLAATRLIRQGDGPRARVPIVALTANAYPEDIKACFDAGMDQFVTKPVSKDALLAATERALRASMGLKPPLVPAIPPGEQRALPFDHAAMDILAEQIGHDRIGSIIEVFQRDAGSRLERLADPSVTPEDLLHEVHALKGAAGSACAALLHKRATVLEAHLRGGGSARAGEIAGLAEAFDAYIAAVAASGIREQPGGEAG